LKDKSKIITDVRIWKSLSNSMEDVLEMDKKFKYVTSFKIDALILNISEEDKKRTVEEANIADEDILIIET
jgi:hypothetical protein